MALFLKDGVWKDTRTDAAPNEGGFIDDAGQVFNAQGEYQPGTGDPSLIFSGGAAVNDPNRSFAPDILVNGRPASDSFYEAKGAVAPSAEQMAQTYDPALGGDFFSQNATPADTGQGLSGLAGFIRGHGYMVPLALMTGGLAIEAAGGLGAASAGIGAGTEGAAYTGAGAAGAGGGAGAGTLAGLETTGAGGLSGGGGFVPTAGSGANFGIDVGANYGLASAAAPLETTGAGGLTGGGGFTPAVDSGANFTIDPTASYTTAGAPAVNAPIGDQPGDYPMPGEDGTASQWTPSNINPQDVTNLLDYNASLNPSTSLTDILKTANQVKQGVSTASAIAKLLGGTGSGTTGGTTGTTSNANLSALANLLKPAAQTNNYVGQIKANQNPFTFTSAGQTLASPGMYDVSGSNLANALRKA